VLKETIEPIVKEVYGVSISDIIKRIEYLNDIVTQIQDQMVTKDIFSLEIKNLSNKIEGTDKRIDDWKEANKMYFKVLSILVSIAGVVIPIVVTVLAKIL
jgi:ABC-type lipoprotein release transport system permease subunit